MGLGLATVQCIVKHGGGYLHAESNIGEGSVFSIYLPPVSQAAGRENRETQESIQGTETVLLVEASLPLA